MLPNWSFNLATLVSGRIAFRMHLFFAAIPNAQQNLCVKPVPHSSYLYVQWEPAFGRPQLGEYGNPMSLDIPIYRIITSSIFSFMDHQGLHPHYPELIALLDKSISQLLLQPTASNVTLDHIRSLLLYIQWMPVEEKVPGVCRTRCKYAAKLWSQKVLILSL